MELHCRLKQSGSSRWSRRNLRDRRREGRVEVKEERKECLTGNPRRRRRRRRRETSEEKRDGERENAAQPAHGCCVLLHFVLTWCMRLLGNSPYAPFIYNSAANAGHASPHPRSVIRLRSALWNAETVAPRLYSARTFACTHIPSSTSVCPLFSLLFHPTASAYFTLNLPLYFQCPPLHPPVPFIAMGVHGLAFMHFSTVYNLRQYLRFALFSTLYAANDIYCPVRLFPGCL